MAAKPVIDSIKTRMVGVDPEFTITFKEKYKNTAENFVGKFSESMAFPEDVTPKPKKQGLKATVKGWFSRNRPQEQEKIYQLTFKVDASEVIKFINSMQSKFKLDRRLSESLNGYKKRSDSSFEQGTRDEFQGDNLDFVFFSGGGGPRQAWDPAWSKAYGPKPVSEKADDEAVVIEADWDDDENLTGTSKKDLSQGN